MSLPFRLADHVVCRKTSTDLRMLFDKRKGVMYELNETASAVIERLEERPGTAEAISRSLHEEFEASQDEIRGDVDRMLADFADAGLVVEE